MMTIGSHLVVNGELSTDEDLTIAGVVEGFVSVRAGTLTVEPTARVQADVRAARVVVRGYVLGGIAASERIELAPSARMDGSLSAPLITIVEGAQFNGAIDMSHRTIAARVAEYRASRPSHIE
jgi:cytoskeletal protein CcmA (bactofilin family)